MSSATEGVFGLSVGLEISPDFIWTQKDSPILDSLDVAY